MAFGIAAFGTRAHSPEPHERQDFRAVQSHSTIPDKLPLDSRLCVADVTPTLATGVVATIVTSSLYTYLKIVEKDASSGGGASHQHLSPPPQPCPDSSSNRLMAEPGAGNNGGQ